MRKTILHYFSLLFSTAIGSIAVSCNFNNKEINIKNNTALISINNIEFVLNNNQTVSGKQIKLSEVSKENIKCQVSNLEKKYDIKIEKLDKYFKNSSLKITFIIKNKYNILIENRIFSTINNFKAEEKVKLDINSYSKLSLLENSNMTMKYITI
ncbi:hypothetical protein [Mycoplasma phocimorsus]|uniref:hypothetical protein n=1 Tax=Mycoplasma phocimorsus TaxID=3045839 RepID=UPI0024BF8A52|nr:hypothetical protein [Mycoplasma phocimorsus]MDJ1648118.1 hypothetical protein [Mycoplasma phocimorsus]